MPLLAGAGKPTISIMKMQGSDNATSLELNRPIQSRLTGSNM
jgi:hypothetical protein